MKPDGTPEFEIMWPNGGAAWLALTHRMGGWACRCLQDVCSDRGRKPIVGTSKS